MAKIRNRYNQVPHLAQDTTLESDKNTIKARCFLLVDLQEFFFRLRVGGTKKINKKALKMTSELVIFRAFFFFFFFLLLFFFYRAFLLFYFLISPEKNSKTSEVNFNLYIFHHCPKNLDRTITFNSVTLKCTKTEPKKIYHFLTKKIIFRVGG